MRGNAHKQGIPVSAPDENVEVARARLRADLDERTRFTGVLAREDERFQPVHRALVFLARQAEPQIEAGIDPVGDEVRPPGQHVVGIVLVVSGFEVLRGRCAIYSSFSPSMSTVRSPE